MSSCHNPPDRSDQAARTVARNARKAQRRAAHEMQRINRRRGSNEPVRPLAGSQLPRVASPTNATIEPKTLTVAAWLALDRSAPTRHAPRGVRDPPPTKRSPIPTGPAPSSDGTYTYVYYDAARHCCRVSWRPAQGHTSRPLESSSRRVSA